MHVYNVFLHFTQIVINELLDTQNLLFPIVFSILHKTPNATILFRPTIFHFIIVFNPSPGCSTK